MTCLIFHLRRIAGNLFFDALVHRLAEVKIQKYKNEPQSCGYQDCGSFCSVIIHPG